MYYECSLCKAHFEEIHHYQKCRDNLWNDIVDELDEVQCLSVLKNILEIIKSQKNLSKI